jgi:hypothetical protein
VKINGKRILITVGSRGIRRRCAVSRSEAGSPRSREKSLGAVRAAQFRQGAQL